MNIFESCIKLGEISESFIFMVLSPNQDGPLSFLLFMGHMDEETKMTKICL